MGVFLRGWKNDHDVAVLYLNHVRRQQPAQPAGYRNYLSVTLHISR